jgi:hypothetical protein
VGSLEKVLAWEAIRAVEVEARGLGEVCAMPARGRTRSQTDREALVEPDIRMPSRVRICTGVEVAVGCSTILRLPMAAKVVMVVWVVAEELPW